MMHTFRLLAAVVMLGCLLLTGSMSSVAQKRPASGHNHDVASAHNEDTDDSDILGEVTALETTRKQFRLRICGSSGQSLTIAIDKRTKFDDFDDAGLANAFSSIAVGQLLEVELAKTNSGTLVAKELELEKRQPGSCR